MLYKAALKDTGSTNSSAESAEEIDGPPPAKTSAPHPYFMALGVLAIQKVIVVEKCNNDMMKLIYNAVFERGLH